VLGPGATTILLRDAARQSTDGSSLTTSTGIMWIWEYLQNVFTEMEKVNWPSWDELISSTLITIVATFIISGFIFLTDQVLQKVLTFLYQQ
jgi:preprotein translocase subunit SecE